MSYKGRVIGFILGLIFANLPGAILFMILGYYFFDRPANKKQRDDAEVVRTFTKNANYNERLVRVTFELMGYVARGAGRVNENHIAQAQQVMNVMSLNSRLRKVAIDAFTYGKSDDFNLDSTISTIKGIIGDNFSFVNFILEIQVQLALSDGKLEEDEYRRLMEIAISLGASRESMESFIRVRYAEMSFKNGFGQGGFYRSGQRDYDYEERSSSYGSSGSSYNDSSSYSSYESDSSKLAAAYTLLGVDSSVSDEELKRAHKKLMLKYHPDRLASQGLTSEMIKLYTEKAKDIQAAFDLIKKERGIK